MREWRIRLDRLLDGLNDDEGDVMLEAARRLVRGRASYGPMNLAEDSRDWNKELSEELFDAVMYRAIIQISKLRKR